MHQVPNMRRPVAARPSIAAHASPAARVGLTRRQAEARDFIERFERENGYSPSQSEIAVGINASKTCAHDLINRLAQRGYVRRQAGHARGVTVIQLPAERDFEGAA